MTNTGLVMQGDDDDNSLEAHAVYFEDTSGGNFDVYNIVHGANGNDTITVETFYLMSQLGVQLYGEDGNDIIWDTNDNNSTMSDTLDGGAGDDEIHQTGKYDVIDGGEGYDSLYVGGNIAEAQVTNVERLVISSRLDVGHIDLAAFDEIQLAADSQFVFFLSDQTNWHADNFTGYDDLTKLSLFGSAHDDVLDMTGSTLSLSLDGRAGDDIIIANDRDTIIMGMIGNDTLTGGAGDDTIDGEGDNDLLNGGDGDDRIYGGNGNDRLFGGNGNDTLTGSAGNDTIHGGEGDDRISGLQTRASERKLLFGDAGNDTFSNWIAAKSKGSILDGGSGLDTVLMSGDITGAHLVSIEAISFNKGLMGDADMLDKFKYIYGEGTTPYIQFTSGGEFRWDKGSVRNGTITGSKGNDLIDMRKASDDWRLATNGGNDTLVGGHGDDAFDLRGLGRTTIVALENSGHDNIHEFYTSGSRRDVIDLSAVSSIKDYDDLVANHMKIYRHTATIEIDEDSTILIQYEAGGKLTESSFIF